ncbi:MAG TPA: NAD-dependent protein deacetylase [bacterium]|nr:NAD-dependent protein deacetylase [bacterium]
MASLADLLRGRPTVVLSGAGISTESGIPDYRGPQGSLRTRKPMQYREFVESAHARRRYWARSTLGWMRVAEAKPNDGHRALAAMEKAGAITGIITQNVDGLHQAAGSIRVLELHGALADVRCLSCGRNERRDAFQERLLAANPGWDAQGAAVAPDGDVDLDPRLEARFSVPACTVCGGVMKPDVVFFGENVPRARVDAAFSAVEEAAALLVVGSSLAVFSGFRFVERAARDHKPVAIVNQGETRGDALAAVRVEGRLGEVLPRLGVLLG